MMWGSGFTTAMYIDVEYITFLPSVAYLCGSEEGTLQILEHIIGKLLAAKLSHSTVTCFRFIHHAPLSAQTSRQQPQQQPPNAAISLSTSKKKLQRPRSQKQSNFTSSQQSHQRSQQYQQS